MSMLVHVSFQTNESGPDCFARKNGSPTSWPNQAGNSPQHQAHNHRIFTRLGVIVGPARDGAKTRLLIQRLGGEICAADLQKGRICLAKARFLNYPLE